MTRTDWLKLGYLAAIGLVATAAGAVAYWFRGDHLVPLAIAAVLLIPGRVMGYFYRDLFRGRRLMEAAEFEESRRHSERFLAFIRKRPKLKRLMWCGWSTYTTDAEAMALNNIGAAHMETGEWEVAESRFLEALGVDPRYPIPYFNLAVLAEIRGERAETERLLWEAAQRGYRLTALDELIHRSQSLLARVEGRGVSQS